MDFGIGSMINDMFTLGVPVWERVIRAVLVYAGKNPPLTRRVAFTDIDVTEHPLDLSQTPAEMLDALDRLAASFAALTAAATSTATVRL